MIAVFAKNVIKEGKVEEFLKLAEEMVVCTRQEEYHVSYELVKDQASENTYCFFEKWNSIEELNMHKDTEHFKRNIPQIAELLEGKETYIMDVIV